MCTFVCLYVSECLLSVFISLRICVYLCMSMSMLYCVSVSECVYISLSVCLCMSMYVSILFVCVYVRGCVALCLFVVCVCFCEIMCFYVCIECVCIYLCICRKIHWKALPNTENSFRLTLSPNHMSLFSSYIFTHNLTSYWFACRTWMPGAQITFSIGQLPAWCRLASQKEMLFMKVSPLRAPKCTLPGD